VAVLIGVHGIGHQFCTREEILQEWAPALAGGIEWAMEGYRPASPPDLDIAFYGRLFRGSPESSPETGTSKGTLADGDADEWADLDPEELDELADAMQEIVPAADLASAEAAPDKSLVWLPARLGCLVGAVERTFPGSGRLVLRTLRQVRRYLVDPQLKQEVDRITAEAATGADVLIGHSLGSVVAYEFVRQHPGRAVKLLTIGSPLGLKMVRGRLPSGELGPTRWINVRDRHDPVTAAGALGRWYPGLAEGWASNGSDAHAAKRYLSSKAVGKAVVEFVPELAR
jgi:hypothetical protein